MKKIIVIGLVFLLSGCFGDTGKGYLAEVCIKTEEDSTSKTEYTYTINYKEKIVSDVVITSSYEDSIENRLSLIKEAIESQNKFWDYEGLEVTILNDEKNHYQVSYEIVLDNVSEEIINHYKLNTDKNKLIKSLKEEGYSCK